MVEGIFIAFFMMMHLWDIEWNSIVMETVIARIQGASLTDKSAWCCLWIEMYSNAIH